MEEEVVTICLRDNPKIYVDLPENVLAEFEKVIPDGYRLGIIKIRQDNLTDEQKEKRKKNAGMLHTFKIKRSTDIDLTE